MVKASKAKKLPDGMILRGRTYYSWFTRNGRAVRKKLSRDLNVATTMLRDLQARVEKGDWGILDNEAPYDEIEKEFIVWAKQALRDASQYEADLKKIKKFQPVKNIKQISTQYIIQYREWRLLQRSGQKQNGRPISPRTVNREVGTLRNMLNKAVEWKRIAFNPIEKLTPLRHDTHAKQRRALSVEEVHKLFEASPDYLRPVWRFLMVTGMRRDEAIELLWSDIDFDQRVTKVRAEWAKNHKERVIPLDDQMIDTLIELQKSALKRQPVPGTTPRKTEQQAANFSRKHVFVTRANTPHRNNLLKRFYECCRKAGINDAIPRGAIDLHSLRVTFTTLALENGASPKAVQELLGHSTLALTMGIYARATERAKRDAINAIPFASASSPKHILSMTRPDSHRISTSVSEETQVTVLASS